MKKSFLVIVGLLLLSGLTRAQVIADFNTPGALGGYTKAADSGVGLDSLYQTAGPTNSGVLAMHFTFTDYANQHGRIVYMPAGGIQINKEQFITWWVYLPSSANIPDSTQISVYAMDNSNYAWTEDKYYIMNLPKDKWYPMSFPLYQHYLKNMSFDIVNGQIVQSGIQITPQQANWTGTIYVDSVSLIGAEPTVVADFASSLQGFINLWHNGWLDSLYWSAGPVGDSTGVMVCELKNGSASTGGTAFGLQPSGSGIAAQNKKMLVFWVYIESTFPDNAFIQTFAQSDPSWNWPSPVGPQTYNGSDIPKQVWYPLYYDLCQASIIDTVSGSYFNTMKSGSNLRKLGLQIGGTTLTGNVYVKDIGLLNNVITTPTGINGSGIIVKKFMLYENYPNPFNPSTMIKYDVAKESKVEIKVYDVLGREVATLVNENKAAGTYEVEFNASKFTSGVYFFRMTAGDYVKTRKMSLIK
ncbi:MAG: T9SS type A sorting domain-containing protein [Bacteroidota bacterium]